MGARAAAGKHHSRALVVSAAEKMRSHGALKALDGVSATLNLSKFCICGENFESIACFLPDHPVVFQRGKFLTTSLSANSDSRSYRNTTRPGGGP